MLEVTNLNFESVQRTLINNISLKLKPGHIHGIIGPNGSGKTTLLKILAGIWKPSSGHVLWNKQDLLALDRLSLSRTVSLVPQNAQVHFDFTVYEIVKMGIYPLEPLKKEDSARRIRTALERVDAWHLRDRYATFISNGERQRMYIARSLVTETPLLLLDEPTSNLDIRHQLEIWELLKKLAADGKLILIANHDLDTTERFCDQVIVMNQGCCVRNGFYHEVVGAEILRSVFGVEESGGRGRQYSAAPAEA